MVTPDSTGAQRERARLDDNRARTHPSEEPRRIRYAFRAGGVHVRTN